MSLEVSGRRWPVVRWTVRMCGRVLGKCRAAVGVVSVLCLWSCLLTGLDTPPTRHQARLTSGHLQRDSAENKISTFDLITQEVLRHEAVVAGEGRVQYRSRSADFGQHPGHGAGDAVAVTGNDVIPGRRIQEIKLGEMDGLGRLGRQNEIQSQDYSLRLTGETSRPGQRGIDTGGTGPEIRDKTGGWKTGDKIGGNTGAKIQRENPRVDKEMHGISDVSFSQRSGFGQEVPDDLSQTAGSQQALGVLSSERPDFLRAGDTGGRKPESGIHENDTRSVIDKLPGREKSTTLGTDAVSANDNGDVGIDSSSDGQNRNRNREYVVYEGGFDKSIDSITTTLDKSAELHPSIKSGKHRHNPTTADNVGDSSQHPGHDSKLFSTNPKANSGAATNVVKVSAHNKLQHGRRSRSDVSDVLDVRMREINVRSDISEPTVIDHLYVPPPPSASPTRRKVPEFPDVSRRRAEDGTNGDKRSDLSRSRFQNKLNTSTLAAGHSAAGEKPSSSTKKRSERLKDDKSSSEFEPKAEEVRDGEEEGVKSENVSSDYISSASQKEKRFLGNSSDVRLNVGRRLDKDGFDMYSYNVTASDNLSLYRDVPDSRPTG